jgi:hypothetical protein
MVVSFSLIDICNDCGMTVIDWILHGVIATVIVALIWLRRYRVL